MLELASLSDSGVLAGAVVSVCLRFCVEFGLSALRISAEAGLSHAVRNLFRYGELICTLRLEVGQKVIFVWRNEALGDAFWRI